MTIEHLPMNMAQRGSLRMLPVLALLHPRHHTRPLLILLALGIVLGGALITLAGLPLWGATTISVGLLLHPAIQKWRDDLARWGLGVMILGVLLVLQGFHTIEHIAQYIEHHVLGWLPKQSGGLISAANVEWIHFAWNWSVLLVVLYLIWKHGMRNIWAWLLLAWATAHTLEHTYLFVRYLQAVRLLEAQGTSTSFAQGLPGIIGRDGWLATTGVNTPGIGFICRLAPPLLTTIRLDVHFWWNVGETVLMLLAAHSYLRGLWGNRSAEG
jgi:hypothetical protein